MEADRVRMRLTKTQSRKRWKEIRELWREWDPIGVMDDPNCPRDEYDGYLGPSLRLLERGAPTEQIAGYLRYVVGEYMGLGTRGIQHSKPEQFAVRLQNWYASKWPDSHV